MRPTLALAVLIVGCSSGATKTTPAPAAAPVPDVVGQQAALSVPTTVAFTSSYDRIWSAIPAAYASLGIKVNAADTSTHAIGFAGVVRHKLGSQPISKYFGCGDAQVENIADDYDITVIAATQLSRNAQGRVLVSMHARATASNPRFAHDNSLCTSKGVLERAIFDSLGVVLGRGR